MTRHRFHSLCPYFAMFPESFAEHWIERVTKPGDVVLDPFSGRGTTATCALLARRRAVALDVNDVAYCLTRAKTRAPPLSKLLARVRALQRGFKPADWRREAKAMPEYWQWAFHADTLPMLLYLRSQLRWRRSDLDSMVAALALGSMHGEADHSHSYFSNQMPRTISTKPAYSVRFWRKRKLRPPERDVFSILQQRAFFRYESPPPVGDALVFHADMRRLPRIPLGEYGRIRAVITSPPYLDVTNFEEDQWLRLWFLGGPPEPVYGRVSTDDRHERVEHYWRFICDMWRSLGRVVARRSHVVVRIGSKREEPGRLQKMLLGASIASGRRIELVSTEVTTIERRQTDAFRPGTKGCGVEVDCHFSVRN